MNKRKAWTVAKVNFKYSTWIAYLVTILCVLATSSNYIMAYCFNQDNTIISLGNYLYLLCLLAPIFVASINYSKLMHIGVKKKTYLTGSIINYVVFAAVVSLLAVGCYYFVDIPLDSDQNPIYNLIVIFGWNTNVFTAFLCQFAFLFFVEVVVHTLTFIQTKWYGFVWDIVIVTIISVFTPIAVLREVEVFFFNMILFVNPAIVQITVCLVLSIFILWTNLFYLKRRNA